MKVAIIGGAGVVGSTAAFRIAQDGYATEVVLVDSRRNLAEAHALDIEQAVVHRSSTKVYAGEIEDTRGSNVILISAGVPHRSSVISRSEFLVENLPLIFELVETLLPESPSAVWLIVSVPVDPLVFLISKYFSIPRQRIIGLNRNDSSRFRWAISKTLGIPATVIDAFVLGEHGETQVPIFSKIRVNGEKMVLSPDQVLEVRNMISNFFTDWNRLQPGRTAGWNSAESIGDLLKSICMEDDKIWCCSSVLEGEYGMFQVSLGVPTILGLTGVKEVLEFELEEEEKEALVHSALTIKKQIKHGEKLLNKA